MKNNKKWVALCLAGAVFQAQAGINDDLNSFFNQMGGGGNVSMPAAWQGQSAGYLTGGNLFMRMPVRNIQLVSVTLPDIKAGCGGIDAYLGSFSFINSDQLKVMGKQILSNAAGYAFDLGLETVCPQCKAVKDYLQRMATDINNMNISTCQAAQSIVGGLVPKTLKRHARCARTSPVSTTCLLTGLPLVRAAGWAVKQTRCSAKRRRKRKTNST